jgi:hypothetical protein
MDNLTNEQLEQIISKLQPQITKLILDKIKNTNINSEEKEKDMSESFIKDDPESLFKSSKAELVAICKSKKLPVSGTKQQLIDRILGKTKSKSPSKQIQTKIKSLTEVIKPKKDRTPTSKKAEKLIEKIKSETNLINTLVLRKNKWDNYEHNDTQLVFNQHTKQAIGIQNRETGRVEQLTKKEIELCKQYKFDYVIPENLNTEDDKDDEIEELDEIEEIEEVEEYEEVEDYEEYEEEEVEE